MQFIRFNKLQRQSTREYWTAERMANAIPFPLPQVKISKENKQRDHKFSKEETEMSFCCAENSRFYPLYAARVDVSVDPYRQVGRLYFRQYGINFWATAQVVGSSNIILTTAHSLKYAGGLWSSYLMFSRAYKDGEAAQNIDVIVSSAGIHSHWNLNSYFMHINTWDYGFAKIERESDVGCLGLSTVLPYELKAVGYPSNYGNMKRFMCEARGTVESVMYGEVKMQRNFMQGGSSGGAWFERNNNVEVVGINSSGDGMGNMYGPLFDDNTIALFYFVRNQH